MSTPSRLDDLLAVIAVILLIVVTATGNALVMLGVSLASLLLIGVLSWKHIQGRAKLAAVAAAMIAAFIGFVVSAR